VGGLKYGLGAVESFPMWRSGNATHKIRQGQQFGLLAHFQGKCGNKSPGSSYIKRTLCMKHCLFILLAFFTIAIDRVGADDKTNKVPKGAKIFIAPMEGDLHSFIAAEIVKKRLPVVVVTEEKDVEPSGVWRLNDAGSNRKNQKTPE
jgi:hypothetical protein